MKRLILQSALLGSLFANPVSAATFIGDSFEGSYRFPHLQKSTVNGGSAVVSPVAQFTFVTGRINPTATISGSNVLITFQGRGRYKAAEFNGILLKNLSRSNIGGFVLDPNSTLSGFDQSRLSFTSDSLFFNFEGLSFRAADRISANVTFLPGAVPEPATWALMITGLGAVGFSVRRRRTSTSRARNASVSAPLPAQGHLCSFSGTNSA